ncbi:hypothetical protein B0H19DRAFT_1264782 [Mycena capillaripes]|nr:hypothetical protein B0H19DRAFT_1264782 [Mycena capillaripes]
MPEPYKLRPSISARSQMRNARSPRRQTAPPLTTGVSIFIHTERAGGQLDQIIRSFFKTLATTSTTVRWCKECPKGLQLQSPPPRGVFVEDDEPNFFDGYDNVASSRTIFPLSGGFFSLNSEHTSWTVGANLFTKANPTTFQDFNSAVVPFSPMSGAGIFCMSLDLSKTNDVQDGQNVTLQFVYDGGDGELFQCADLTLSRTAQVSSNVCCRNGTTGPCSDFGSAPDGPATNSFSLVQSSPSTTTGSGSRPTSLSSSTSSGSLSTPSRSSSAGPSEGFRKKPNVGAIVGGLISGIAIIILITAFFLHRWRQRNRTSILESGLASTNPPALPISFIVNGEQEKSAQSSSTSNRDSSSLVPLLVPPHLISLKREQATAGLHLSPGRVPQTGGAGSVSSVLSSSEPQVVGISYSILNSSAALSVLPGNNGVPDRL